MINDTQKSSIAPISAVTETETNNSNTIKEEKMMNATNKKTTRASAADKQVKPQSKNAASAQTVKNIPAVKDTVQPAVQPAVDGAFIKAAAPSDEFVYLNNKDLQINPKIQRRLSPIRVSKIVKNYSSLIANPIKVSFRDGQYYIFDGMHTRTATSIVKGTDDFPILCRVYHNLTEEDEARLFSEQFGYSEAVPMAYRLRALEVAKDPEVLDFLKVTRDSGFTISLGSYSARNGNIAAVCAAFYAYRNLGASGYGLMLKTLLKTWVGENWSISRNMLGGMARFMTMYEFKPNSFVKVFREVSYEEIRMEALRFTGMTKEGAYATALAEIYDRNSRNPLKETA